MFIRAFSLIFWKGIFLSVLIFQWIFYLSFGIKIKFFAFLLRDYGKIFGKKFISIIFLLRLNCFLSLHIFYLLILLFQVLLFFWRFFYIVFICEISFMICYSFLFFFRIKTLSNRNILTFFTQFRGITFFFEITSHNFSFLILFYLKIDSLFKVYLYLCIFWINMLCNHTSVFFRVKIIAILTASALNLWRSLNSNVKQLKKIININCINFILIVNIIEKHFLIIWQFA